MREITRPGARTLIDGFLQACTRYPDETALVVGGETFSYRELHNRAARLAAVLEKMTLQGGQCGVFAGRTAEAFSGLLAAQMRGMAYVPMDETASSARLVEIVRMADLSAVVISARNLSRARPVLQESARSLTVILPETEALPGWAEGMHRHRFFTAGAIPSAQALSRRIRMEPEGLAFVLFPSDVRRFPSGLIATHWSVSGYIQRILRRYVPTPLDRFSQVFPLHHPASLHEMFVCWTAGAALCVRPDDEETDDFIRRHAVTFWLSDRDIPARLAEIGRLAPQSLPSLRFSLFCGHPLETARAAQWAAAAESAIVEHLYGPTEVTICSTVYQYDSEQAAAFPVLPLGAALSGQEVILLDDEGEPVPPGKIGELYLGGEFQMSGRRMTAGHFLEKTFPGRDSGLWFRTGDLARWLFDVGLVHEGRVYMA